MITIQVVVSVSRADDNMTEHDRIRTAMQREMLHSGSLSRECWAYLIPLPVISAYYSRGCVANLGYAQLFLIQIISWISLGLTRDKSLTSSF